MPKPYLHRRGDSYFFRVAVPVCLRPIIGGRELTKTLRTSDKRAAAPKALQYAAAALRLFNEIRAEMSSTDPKKVAELLRERKASQRVTDLKEQYVDEISDLHDQRIREVQEAKRAAKSEIDALKGVLASVLAAGTHAPVVAAETPPPTVNALPEIFLATVVDHFLQVFPRDKKAAMYSKHSATLPMLLEVIGNKPITELEQADIDGFFALLEKLPPQWNAECRKRNLTIRQLAEINWPLCLAPKTFKHTYVACVRSFLTWAKSKYKSFPTHPSVGSIEYGGDREAGENQQRAFKPSELKRLFEGVEMQAFAADPAQAHMYWLPHIGLFTGARVNEICQLNPQTDILQDTESGIWYFHITEKTEGDTRIKKSVKGKGKGSRKVPIHSKLIELGLLAYVDGAKAQGAKLLFPSLKVWRERASANAEKLFRQLLRDTGLRDETPGARIVGMHAFRSTLLNHASNLNPPIDATSITGHAAIMGKEKKTPVVKGYEGPQWLVNKHRILEAIQFDINFQTPRVV